ncbi:O-antigen ligase family protein [Mucilaginibacter phenanthrenivorans]|uniref:O-antigen ligase family protein n=1 Tax=Mucilaginibacter phenanthrenivorans TaxID=1234842 RepID=UPI00215836AD|nr:O-antigen ligase family protein [Mucilaginibacter phenanthrenivorans]
MAFNSVKKGEQLIGKILKIFFLLAIYGIIESLLHANPIIDFLANSSSKGIDADTILRYTADDDRGYRVQTIFYHAYSWGGCLVILASTYLYLVFNAKTTTLFYKYSLVFLIIFLNIFFTRSRSCFLPTMASIFALLWIMPRNKKKAIFISFLVMATVFSMAFSPKLLDSFKMYFTAKDDGSVKGSSSELRATQLASAVSTIKDKLITGNGFGSVRKLLHDSGSDTDLKGAESIWFVVLIDTGIIGIIAYLLFYINIIRSFIKEKKKALNKDISRGVSVIIVTIICHFTFISLTGEMNTFPFFMLYLGIASKYIFVKLREEKENALYNEYPDAGIPVISESAVL